jgi:hypothetical protein
MQRRAFIAGSVLLATVPSAMAQDKPVPNALRLKMATTAGPDVKKIEAWYTQWLGYITRERGTVSAELAASWGAPKAAGRAYVLMSAEGSPDVFLRAVETDAVPGYEPMTTWGWNAWEIIVDDIAKVNEKIKGSPFTVIGGPKALNGYPSIVAMQVRGPADEIIYLTSETGDRTKSLLPAPKSLIDRIFILVVAGPEIEKLRDWYADTLTMAKQPINNTTVDIIARAQGLPLDTPRPLTLLSLRQHGNLLELDGYPGGKGARPRPPGQLPPGNAMATLSVASLDAIKAPFVKPPAKLPGAAYGGRRAATLIGPAGEPVELIEEA